MNQEILNLAVAITVLAVLAAVVTLLMVRNDRKKQKR